MNKEEARPTLLAWTGTKGAYVSVRPTAASTTLLSRIATQLGLTPSVSDVFKYHCTVMWSETTPKVCAPNNCLKFSAKLKGIEYWLGHDSDGYVVVTLDSEDLDRRHAYWRSLGATHSFEDYSPHSTVASKLSLTPELTQRLAIARRTFIGSELHFFDESCVDVS